MKERLPESVKVDTTQSYVKIGLQVNPKLYKMFKIASVKEGRNNRELLNDAIQYYIESKHPDLLKIEE